MKQTAMFLVVGLCVAGCVTSTSTVVHVSGDGSQGFNARMETRNRRVFTIATITKEDEPHAILHTRREIVTCDLRKQETAARIVVEVLVDDCVVVRAEAPPGTQGVRIEKVAADWKQQPY